MLRIIRRWLWRRRRSIFRFFDGDRVRAVDPIAVAIALHEHEKFLPRHLSEAAGGDPEAQQIVAQAACDVFGVLPLAVQHEYGLSMAERIELMIAFDAYLMSLKKSIDRSLTPQDFTAPASQTSNEPTTSDTSDSGSTDTDKQSVNRTLQEQASPPVSEN